MIDGIENPYNANWYYDPNYPKAANERDSVGDFQTATGDELPSKSWTASRLCCRAWKAQLPPSIDMFTLYDRSITIRNSVDDVKFTLELALFLVIMVIFLFLRNISATTIPSLALPFSIVGTFAVMYLGGYSLDNLSLMALTLSVGFVVDDAIVMLENIVRHLEHGESVMEAALNGSNEIGFTILSMTLSLAAVFIPILFMGGVLGRLLKEFAVTVMSAILVSGFVSLTLTPMLCSRFLKPHHEIKHGRLFNFFERIQVAQEKAYERALRVALRHKLATMTAAGVLLVGTVYLFMVIPKGFFWPPAKTSDSSTPPREAVEGISIRRYGGAPEASCRDRGQRPGGRLRDVRSRRPRPNLEPRAVECPAETAHGAPAGGPSHSGDASEGRRGAWHDDLYAQRSSYSHRRSTE